MKFTSINSLKEDILLWTGLILYEDIYKLIHFDKKKAPDTWRQIVTNTLRKYEQTYPLQILNKRLPQLGSYERYKFESNFDQYLAGEIAEEDIQLVPQSIYFISGWLNTNCQWWVYDQVNSTFIPRIASGNQRYSYYACYPCVWNKDNDGEWTEDSGIYYLDNDTDGFFRRFITYYTLLHIQAINRSNTLNNSIKFLENIDEMVKDAKEEMDLLINTRSKIYQMWRK